MQCLFQDSLTLSLYLGFEHCLLQKNAQRWLEFVGETVFCGVNGSVFIIRSVIDSAKLIQCCSASLTKSV